MSSSSKNPKTVNIVGFEYRDHLYLPGIVLDLYQAYKYFRQRGYVVNVITDVKKDVWNPLFVKAVAECIVDADVATFIQDIKSSNNYWQFQNGTRLVEWIRDHPCQVMFYSGHGIQDRFMLPTGEGIDIDAIRDLVCYSNPLGEKICFILDCCHPHGLQLPYALFPQETRYKSHPVSSSSKVTSDYDIQCLVSSAVNEKSVTSKCGSVCTQSLFQLLQRKMKYIPDLVTQIQKDIDSLRTGFDQKIGIYVTNNRNYNMFI